MGAGAAAAAVLGTVGGSVLKARAARQEGDAAFQAGMFNAINAREEGYRAEASVRREGRRELAMDRVKIAKAGLAPTGSVLDLMAQNVAELEREALEARLRGNQEYGLQRRAARSAYKQGRNVSYASILSGVAGGVSTGMRVL